MSATTQQAVEDAIAAHIADEYPDEPWFVTHWYAVACASDAEMDRTNYVRVALIAHDDE